jgi:hypothetical protein
MKSNEKPKSNVRRETIELESLKSPLESKNPRRTRNPRSIRTYSTEIQNPRFIQILRRIALKFVPIDGHEVVG